MEGSHFRNDDLVQESRLVDDYDIEITFDGERDGMRVWKLTPTPRPEAAVVWGRVEYAMRQADALAVSVYYDEDGERARSMDWGRLPEPGRNEAAIGTEMSRQLEARSATRWSWSRRAGQVHVHRPLHRDRHLTPRGWSISMRPTRWCRSRTSRRS